MGDFSVTSTSKGSKASLKGGHSKSLDDSLKGTDGFKKGGSCMKKGGKAVMSKAAKGKKPARASGGGVLSSAAGSTPRKPAQHY